MRNLIEFTTKTAAQLVCDAINSQFKPDANNDTKALVQPLKIGTKFYLPNDGEIDLKGINLGAGVKKSIANDVI